ncbi:MAG TPA: hypothetical protein VG412_09565 [Acidimicrobiales bacterium]|nr:hypothetical protein [Acidimicrobiales bacterium]
MTGFVVVVEVVGAVVVVVVVGSAADEELDDPEVDEVGGEMVPEVTAVPEAGWVADDEWAVVSVPTSRPSPTAPAMAATPMAAVVRRTRDIARSLTPAADGLVRLFRRAGCAMS